VKPYFTDSTGTITIFHGDCRELLPSIKADVVVTDPPYGIRYASNHTGPTTTARWMNSEIAGDADTGARDFVLLQFNEWACFGSYDAPAPGLSEDVLIWDKGPASGMGDLAWPWKRSWELVFVRGCGWSGSRDEGVLKGHHIVTRASMGRVHPNEKPVSLLRYLIGKHSGEIILDPFMGSNTTWAGGSSASRSTTGISAPPAAASRKPRASPTC